jgi:hypothetical protein
MLTENVKVIGARAVTSCVCRRCCTTASSCFLLWALLNRRIWSSHFWDLAGCVVAVNTNYAHNITPHQTEDADFCKFILGAGIPGLAWLAMSTKLLPYRSYSILKWWDIFGLFGVWTVGFLATDKCDKCWIILDSYEVRELQSRSRRRAIHPRWTIGALRSPSRFEARAWLICWYDTVCLKHPQTFESAFRSSSLYSSSLLSRSECIIF